MAPPLYIDTSCILAGLTRYDILLFFIDTAGNETIVPAHKAILSTASPYFNKTQLDATHIIDELKPGYLDIAERLVRFMYIGRIDLKTPEELTNAYELAEYLELDIVIPAIKKELTNTNPLFDPDTILKDIDALHLFRQIPATQLIQYLKESPADHKETSRLALITYWLDEQYQTREVPAAIQQDLATNIRIQCLPSRSVLTTYIHRKAFWFMEALDIDQLRIFEKIKLAMGLELLVCYYTDPPPAWTNRPLVPNKTVPFFIYTRPSAELYTPQQNQTIHYGMFWNLYTTQNAINITTRYIDGQYAHNIVMVVSINGTEITGMTSDEGVLSIENEWDIPVHNVEIVAIL